MSKHIKNNIQTVDLEDIEKMEFQRRFVGCLVLTQNYEVLLQKRGHGFSRYPNYLSEFGGVIEENETASQALIRELYEELGAIVEEEDVFFLGAIADITPSHTDIIYGFFWFDRKGTISGCYEGQARYFDNIKEIEAYHKKTDVLYWLLNEYQKKVLVHFYNADDKS